MGGPGSEPESLSKADMGSWDEKFSGVSRVHTWLGLVRIAALVSEMKRQSMFDSEVPLWWWKLGCVVEICFRCSSLQSFCRAWRLLCEDFSEQFESAPIRMTSFAFLTSLTKLISSSVHSKYSSSLPLVGKYTEIARNRHSWIVILMLENLVFLVFRFVISAI